MRAVGYTGAGPMLVKPKEAALILGISRDRVYELIHSKELKAKRTEGGYYMIPVAELERWAHQTD